MQFLKASKAILQSFQTNEDLRRVFEPHGRCPLSFVVLKFNDKQRGCFINAIKIKHDLIKKHQITRQLLLHRKICETIYVKFCYSYTFLMRSISCECPKLSSIAFSTFSHRHEKLVPGQQDTCFMSELSLCVFHHIVTLF